MNAQRARRLLVGGLVGGLLASVLGVVVTALVRGGDGAWTCLFAGVVVVGFFAVGQGIQVAVAEARTTVIMTAALASYVLRVAAVTVLFVGYDAYATRLAIADRTSLFVGVGFATAGWVAGEIRAFRRLRVPVFDEEYRPPGQA